MRIDLQINNTNQRPIADEFFQKIADEVFAQAEFDFFGPPAGGKNISVSLALISPEEIRGLNREYRQNDSVTDILSFAEYKNLEEIKKVVDSEVFLGELVLCYDDIKEYADKEGIKLEKELANVVSHGILHLLGFEHGEKMFSLQKRIKNKF